MYLYLYFRMILQDDQPEVQGPAVWISTERGATQSPIGMYFELA